MQAIPADLSLDGACERLFREVDARGIKVDVLVNNAGAGCCGLFHEIPYRFFKGSRKS